MEFTLKEKLEILEKLGYKIIQIKDTVKSRKSKLFSGKNHQYFVEKDGERLEVPVAFKKELINKIFNI